MELVLTNVTARAVKQSQPTLDNLVYGPQQLGSYHPSPGRHEMCCVGASDICITLPLLIVKPDTEGQSPWYDGATLYLLSMGWGTAQWGNSFTKHGVIGKIFFVKKYLITSSVFKLQNWFLYQNGVKFNQKSKREHLRHPHCPQCI